MKLTLITNDISQLHEISPGHIESPLRINAILQAIKQSSIANNIEYYKSKPADLDIVKLAHSDSYINTLMSHTPKLGYRKLPLSFCANPENVQIGPNTFQAALHAVGSVLSGIDLLHQKKAHHIFCLTRPPGHHAEQSRAIGYCYFNNLAICALYAIQKMYFKKIAIVDFDAHHGNGIESILRDRNDILYISSYQHPYNNFKEPPCNKNCIRIHLSAKSGGDEFRAAWSQIGLQALEDYKPQLILVAAGFDGHYMDQMSDLLLNDQDFSWLATLLVYIANKYADGRILSALEGGYNLNILGKSVVTYLNAFTL